MSHTHKPLVGHSGPPIKLAGATSVGSSSSTGIGGGGSHTSHMMAPPNSGAPGSAGYGGYGSSGPFSGGGFSAGHDKPMVGSSGPGSGVFSPLQSPLSSPRINYPPAGFNPTLMSTSALPPGLPAGGKQLPPLTHTGGTGPGMGGGTGGTGTGMSTSSFVGTFPGQQTGGGGGPMSSAALSSNSPNTNSTHSQSLLAPGASGGSSTNSTYEQEVERMGAYARTKLDAVMKDMLMSLFAQSPLDPVQFMITFLQEYQKKHPAEPPHQLPYLGVPGGPKTNRNRRSAVSAEPLIRTTTKERPPTVIPKSDADKARIRSAVSKNFLFEGLEPSQLETCLDAMELKDYKAGDPIIVQGEEGEHFFVIDSGDAECFVQSQDKPKPRLVRKYTAGDSFGELALMYGCPRTATVKAKTSVQIWAMDRLTFHRVLMETTAQRREKYEKFLTQVPLFAGLDRYERARIADSLHEKTFEDQEFIIEQGDEKDNSTFYILAEGECKAVKTFGDSDKPLEVMRYKPGDYFGELVLMANSSTHTQPPGAPKRPMARSATVIALGNVKVLTLDRGVFLRLLGPLQEVLKRTRSTYEVIEKELEAYVKDGKANIAPPVYYQKRRRTGVSAEPSSETSKAQDLKVKQVVIPKTAQQLANIRKAISSNICFQSLDEDTTKKVLDAMFEVKYTAGATIIEQGADGDYFYVVDSGVCECFLKSPPHNVPKLVATYEHGESFGELALMYNCPRAATIRAKSASVVLWAVDRMTFRFHIMEQTSKKRKRYEDFLASVPLLSSLDRYERSKIADCLTSQSYSDGALIIRQGDAGDAFYLLEEGKAKATKTMPPAASTASAKHVNHKTSNEPVDVFHYDVGSYFGELALLTSQPRAANVVAVGPCRCVCIDRASFTRLLGPMSDILRRNWNQYREMEKKLGFLPGSAAAGLPPSA